MTVGAGRFRMRPRAIALFAVIGLLMWPGAVASATTTTFTGSLDAAGQNWVAHRFDVSGPGQIDATLDWATTSANLNLFLYDPSGAQVASAVGVRKPERISFAADTAGTWKLGIKAKSGVTGYTLSVDHPGSGVQVPQFVRTIGGPGHAEIYPSGVDVDALGNVYVADTGDDQVSSYTPAGTVRWTTGASSGRTFSNPRDVAFLGGRVYVADTGNGRVQVLDAGTGQPVGTGQWTNAFSTIMGISAGVSASGSAIILVSESLPQSRVRLFTPSGAPHSVPSIGTGPGEGAGFLNEERDAATDADGNIYVADYKNQRIAVFGPLGGWKYAWGTRGTQVGQFRLPYGVDVDDAGDVYVADANNERIQKFHPDAVAGTATFMRAYGSAGSGAGQFEMMRRVAVASGASPDVYGADLWNYKIERFSQGGAYEDTYGGVGPADGRFNEAYGMSVTDQYTFVIDTTNQRGQRFSSTPPYDFDLKWGARGWGEGNPGFNWPRDLTVVLGTHVWVADTKNNRLTEFDLAGNATGRKLGSYGSAIGQLNYPYAIDAVGGDLIVADSKNNRVQRWDPDTANVVWSTGGFNFPRDVDAGGGSVFVADTRNDRIVRLDADTGQQLGSPIGTANLHGPEGVAARPDGTLWVSDTRWDRLIEFGPTGVVRQRFGSFGTGMTNFKFPAHLEIVTVGGVSQLFVADVENDRIQVYQLG